jgi:hypothetical protein
LRPHLGHQFRIFLEDFTGKTEAEALSFHHPINHRTRRATAKSVKQVVFGADDQQGPARQPE